MHQKIRCDSQMRIPPEYSTGAMALQPNFADTMGGALHIHPGSRIMSQSMCFSHQGENTAVEGFGFCGVPLRWHMSINSVLVPLNFFENNAEAVGMRCRVILAVGNALAANLASAAAELASAVTFCESRQRFRRSGPICITRVYIHIQWRIWKARVDR